MAYFEENSRPIRDLEAMVDKVGLRNVVWALAHICREKEDHVRANWQDEHTSSSWAADARKLDRIAGLLAG